MTQLLRLFDEQEVFEAAKPVARPAVTSTNMSRLKGQLRSSLSIDSALQQIFTSKQEETGIQKARRIMGTSLAATTDGDVEVFLTELQFMIAQWLDEFEKQAYGGMTLKQLLRQG